jgi:hypothetical protein
MRPTLVYQRRCWWRGQGTPAPYEQYNLTQSPVQDLLSYFSSQRESLRDEVCGHFKGKKARIDQ